MSVGTEFSRHLNEEVVLPDLIVCSTPYSFNVSNFVRRSETGRR